MLYFRPTPRLRRIVLPLTLLALPSACHKRVVPAMGPGVRVRISAPELSSTRLVGEVESVVGDTLAIKLDESGAISTVPFTAMERIDVSRGSSPGNTAFMVAGAVIGAGIGITAAVRASSEDCSNAFVDACSAKVGAWLALPALGLGAGMLAGWLVSAPFYRTEGWEEAPPEYVRVGINPANGGIALAFSVKF